MARRGGRRIHDGGGPRTQLVLIVVKMVKLVKLVRSALALALASAASVGAAEAPAVTAPAPAAQESPPARTVHLPPKPGEIRELTIKQLGNFDYNPLSGGNIPADVSALSGATVRVSGTVTPWQQAGDKITQFALTDGESCCFGKPPQIQHVIVVDYPAGVDARFATSRFSVEGVLTVDEKKSGGFVTGLFTLRATSVTVLPK